MPRYIILTSQVAQDGNGFGTSLDKESRYNSHAEFHCRPLTDE